MSRAKASEKSTRPPSKVPRPNSSSAKHPNPGSLIPADNSPDSANIQTLQESLQAEKLVSTRSSAPFEILAKGTANTKCEEPSKLTSASSMASRGEAEMWEPRREDMVLAQWDKATSREVDLAEALHASAFSVMSSNEERLAYFYTKISEEVRRGEPRIKSSTASTLEKFNDSVSSSSVAKCLSSPDSNTSLSQGIKRSAPEPQPTSFQTSETGAFKCRHCELVFGTGQALGGHMSRKHSGKSFKFNHKKDVRTKREFERMKLYVAKKKYFESMNYDYEEMVQNIEGKMKVKSLINRSQIKKIKASLTEREVYICFK